MPESKRHFKLRTTLFAILELALGKDVVLGSDQFVYWNARDPRRCLAPDVFVFVGRPDEDIQSWKTWERGGPPQLAVEITSDSDHEPLRWDDKLERYHELGVRELVRFDADAAPGRRLRVWDRLDDDLVERIVEGDSTPCLTLGLTWLVAPLADLPAALRLAREAAILPTPDEARAAAERRVAELEATLAEERARR
ncbi:MAG: Uma2 family endonuclease [Deltaproteobacteria bacterium]|nr:Uma2 family endonuclease [Deltaproteobacteria bacterium]